MTVLFTEVGHFLSNCKKNVSSDLCKSYTDELAVARYMYVTSQISISTARRIELLMLMLRLEGTGRCF